MTARKSTLLFAALFVCVTADAAPRVRAIRQRSFAQAQAERLATRPGEQKNKFQPPTNESTAEDFTGHHEDLPLATPPQEQKSDFLPLTNRSIADNFTDHHEYKQLERAFTANQWKPSKAWLDTTGKQYGRLLIVSDMHPGPGVDHDTGHTNYAEHFKTLQEAEFHGMLIKEWADAKADGKVRTLVLNGDILDFMQTTVAPEGTAFTGKSDAFGPLNSPRNIEQKLQAIYEGHPDLFATYAEHLARGNRIVILPGNHDRQLQHPAVQAKLRSVLRKSLIKYYEKNGASLHLATAHAYRILKDRFELQPNFFMHGDLFARHGNEHDTTNSFSTMLGSRYAQSGRDLKPGAVTFTRDVEMESAFGDQFVKSTFSNIQKRVTWGGDTSDYLDVAMTALTTEPGWGKLKAIAFIAKAVLYDLRSGGRGTQEEVSKQAMKEREEIARDVRENGLTAKFNELRAFHNKPLLTDAGTTNLILHYKSLNAPPILNMFERTDGLWKRLWTMATNFGKFRELMKVTDYEDRANNFLFNELGIKTKSTGHDHVLRIQRYVVGTQGQERISANLDTGTWTDARLNPNARDAPFVTGHERGVVTVDFDEQGSHAGLYKWDQASNRLLKAAPVQSLEEATGQK